MGIRGSGAACAASKFNVVNLVALDQRTISPVFASYVRSAIVKAGICVCTGQGAPVFALGSTFAPFTCILSLISNLAPRVAVHARGLRSTAILVCIARTELHGVDHDFASRIIFDLAILD